jgi:hypothetical protein
MRNCTTRATRGLRSRWLSCRTSPRIRGCDVTQRMLCGFRRQCSRPSFTNPHHFALYAVRPAAVIAAVQTHHALGASPSGHDRPIRLRDWHVRSYVNCGCAKSKGRHSGFGPLSDQTRLHRCPPQSATLGLQRSAKAGDQLDLFVREWPLLRACEAKYSGLQLPRSGDDVL